MKWQDWATIGTALTIVIGCAIFIIVSSVMSISCGELVGGIAGLSIGSVLLFISGYFIVQLWRFRL